MCRIWGGACETGMTMSEPLILVLDEGTTSTRAIVCSPPTAKSRGVAQRELTQYLSAPGLGRARCRRDLGGARSACAREAVDQAGGSGADRRHRHHQPARDGRRLGQGHRRSACTARSSGRTGAPPSTAGALREAGPGARMRRPRPGCCSIPISRPPRCAGCSTTMPAVAEAAAAGPACVRHGRELAGLAS